MKTSGGREKKAVFDRDGGRVEEMLYRIVVVTKRVVGGRDEGGSGTQEM